MKRTLSALTIALFLALTSCYGKFGAFNAVQNWNGNLGDKWVNSVVHAAMWIVPAYELILLGDILVFNTIEFWTGSNPIAANITVDRDHVLVEVEERLYELHTNGPNSVVVSRDGIELGVATRIQDGWAWDDNTEGRTMVVDDDEARALVAMLPDV